MKKTFEDFLMEQYMIESPEILDDDLPDGFEEWVGELEPFEWIQYADEYKLIKE